jgi:hypothetical protein
MPIIAALASRIPPPLNSICWIDPVKSTRLFFDIPKSPGFGGSRGTVASMRRDFDSI